MRRMIALGLAISGLMATGIGCSSSDDGGDDAEPSAETTTTEARHELVATLASNGGTLGVVPGDRIRVVLAGPGWTFDDTSDADVVSADGEAEELPASPECPAGGDCGSSTAYFEISGPGSADIVASRDDCTGAEPTCVTGEGAFRLTVDASESG